MIDKELALIVVPAVSWLLFSLGGYRQKWWRRFVLPAVFMITLLAFRHPSWCVLSVGGLACGAFCLGYGEEKSWLARLGVGCAFAAISLPLGLTLWQAIIPMAWLSMFALSNWKPTARPFTWKIVEGLMGALIGISVAILL